MKANQSESHKKTGNRTNKNVDVEHSHEKHDKVLHSNIPMKNSDWEGHIFKKPKGNKTQ